MVGDWVVVDVGLGLADGVVVGVGLTLRHTASTAGVHTDPNRAQDVHSPQEVAPGAAANLPAAQPVHADAPAAAE